MKNNNKMKNNNNNNNISMGNLVQRFCNFIVIWKRPFSTNWTPVKVYENADFQKLAILEENQGKSTAPIPPEGGKGDLYVDKLIYKSKLCW
jgi:hypothetical protein